MRSNPSAPDSYAREHHVGKEQRDSLETDVHVLDDGRIDVRFHGHKLHLASVLALLNEQREAKNAVREAEKGKEQEEPVPDVADEGPSIGELDEHFPIKMNIVIQIVGSRGDVQPFIAIGQALKRCGHRVRLATHLAFRDFVKSHGLEFFNIGGDPAKLMAFMVKNPGLMPDLKTIRSGAIRQRRNEMRVMIKGCWRSCYETGEGIDQDGTRDPDIDSTALPFVADAIIANPPSFAHVSCAEKLGIPLNMMFTMPWSATQSFPHPLATVHHNKTQPSVANFSSYALVEVLIWEGLGDIINTFREKTLALSPLDAIRAPSMAHKLKLPYTYLWSPTLLPKPPDWMKYIDITGFIFLPEESNYTPPDELVAFLNDGPPPVYIGFGSIVVDDPAALTKTIFDALESTGQRAVVNKGWGNIGSSELEVPKNVYMIGSCPHDWLFQHVSCVVHHGGAGTTAAGLLLGCPTIIIPFFGDQPFWGSMVAQIGAGPDPIPHKELTADKLAAAIEQALKPETKAKAKETSRKMQLEHGVQNTVRSFHKHLDLKSIRCDLCPRRPAVWWVRHLDIKLSPFAAAVLVRAGLIKEESILLYRAQEYDTTYDPSSPLVAGGELLYSAVTDTAVALSDIPADIHRLLHHKHQHHDQTAEPPNEKDKGAVAAPSSQPPPVSEPSEPKHLLHQPDDDVRPEDRVASAWCPWDEQENGEGSHTAHHAGARAGQVEAKRPRTPPSHRDSAYGSIGHRGSASDGAHSPGPDETSHLANEGNRLDQASINELMTSRTSTQKYSGSHELALETGHQVKQGARQVLDWVIMIPTDLSLRLSRGFHNLPLKYHDRTLKQAPEVRGVRSGYRAAGTEFTQEFYQGITGVATQPAKGYSEQGSVGFVKGIGKGMGGLVLKPMAGVIGLVGYPLHGLHKSIRHSLARGKDKELIASRRRQGLEDLLRSSIKERASVIEGWNELVAKTNKRTEHAVP